MSSPAERPIHLVAIRRGRTSLVCAFAIIIDDGIRAGDETECERGGEGEHGEEEHLKCSHTDL